MILLLMLILSSIGAIASKSNVVVGGDSLSTDLVSTGWATQTSALSNGAKWNWINKAVAGRTADVCNANFGIDILPNLKVNTGLKTVVSSLMGNNDLNAGDSAAAIFAELQTFWAAVRSGGGLNLAMTVPCAPYFQPEGSDWDNRRLSLNSMILGGSSYWDACYDASGKVTYAQMLSGTPPNVYTIDGTHMTTYEYGLWAADINDLSILAAE